MPSLDQLTDAALNDAPNYARSKAAWPAMRLRAIPHLVVRSFAALIGLASIVAVSIMGALSMAGYGVDKLLEKVPPIRATYQFLSTTYDRLIDHIGHKILRDQRDTPALRIMLSLTLTTVPIFA